MKKKDTLCLYFCRIHYDLNSDFECFNTFSHLFLVTNSFLGKIIEFGIK